ncbi:MAG: hypothetical protein ACE5GX_08600 [Thermoanaerobaculia bacterium]
MRDETIAGTASPDATSAAAGEALDNATAGREAAVVRVLCVNGELSRAIIGYGDTSDEAYQSAVTEARAFCRHHGGTQKITKL